jgi:16S rRNA (guanine527-N7)-methyltransferase
VLGEPAPALVDALLHAQRLGFLGQRPIPEVISHARGFVRALVAARSDQDPIESVVDLGSGAGLPGLVIAHDLPDVRVTLLDRRAKRTDVLERTVRRLGWQDRITVVCDDVTRYRPESLVDAVVARGFGPPAFTLTQAARLIRPDGMIVISEPPGRDRWDGHLLRELGMRRVEQPVVGSTASRDRELDGLVAVFVPH